MQLRFAMAMLFAALAAQACGGSTKVTGGSSSGQCTADPTCDDFMVACNNGDQVSVAGCRTNSGCRTKEQLPASLCAGTGFASVTTAVASSQSSGGASGSSGSSSSSSSSSGASSGTFGSDSCRDNVMVITLPTGQEAMHDCTIDHQLCKDDGMGGTSCQNPDIGDQCSTGTIACTADHRPATCKSGAYVAIKDFKLSCTCNDFAATGGKNTLFCEGDDLRDYSIAGTPCDVPDKASCSPDLTEEHVCQNNKWTTTHHCGAGACEVYASDATTAGVVRCSYGGYGVGDPCDFASDKVACSSDLTQVLNCVGGETVVKQTCPSGQECRRALQNGSTILHCGTSGYVAGDLCHFPEGALLCSADMSTVLVCHNGMMNVDTHCSSSQTCQTVVENGVPIGACK